METNKSPEGNREIERYFLSEDIKEIQGKDAPWVQKVEEGEGRSNEEDESRTYTQETQNTATQLYIFTSISPRKKGRHILSPCNSKFCESRLAQAKKGRKPHIPITYT